MNCCAEHTWQVLHMSVNVPQLTKHDIACICRAIAAHPAFAGTGVTPQPTELWDGGIDLLRRRRHGDAAFKDIRFDNGNEWPWDHPSTDTSDTWFEDHKVVYRFCPLADNESMLLTLTARDSRNDPIGINWTAVQKLAVKEIFERQAATQPPPPALVVVCHECKKDIRKPKPSDWFLWDDNSVRPMCGECMRDRVCGGVRVTTSLDLDTKHPDRVYSVAEKKQH